MLRGPECCSPTPSVCPPSPLTVSCRRNGGGSATISLSTQTLHTAVAPLTQLDHVHGGSPGDLRGISRYLRGHTGGSPGISVGTPVELQLSPVAQPGINGVATENHGGSTLELSVAPGAGLGRNRAATLAHRHSSADPCKLFGRPLYAPQRYYGEST